jgi:hypothetical protein
MTIDEQRQLDNIADKLRTLDSTADLSPKDRADFDRLTTLWDEEQHASYVSSQMAQFDDSPSVYDGAW